jgi:hypothetical protein
MLLELSGIRPTRSGFSVRRLSNAYLSLEIVPDLGARIVSFKNALTGREWCWHPGEELRLFTNRYGDSFDESPNAGFDECFPSIEACHWQGRDLPCHGEVWSVPWTVDEKAWEEGIISTTVSCRQSPFEMNRQVSIRGPSRTARGSSRLADRRGPGYPRERTGIRMGLADAVFGCPTRPF